MGQRCEVTGEVGTQQFKRDVRASRGHGIDALLVVVCAAIGQVIPVHHGDDGMAEVHGGHGLR